MWEKMQSLLIASQKSPTQASGKSRIIKERILDARAFN